ncbi:MAG: M14 family metallopeptidase [Bacillota bacterium]|jgi:murein tripeptide amidase MpaA
MEELRLDYTRFLTYAELEAALQQFAADYPELTRLYSIGQSYQGRELYLLEITNRNTGPAEDKPGYYIDGNHHAGEVTGSAVCLYTIDYLLTNYGVDSLVTHLVDNIVFYILPRVSPDGAELYLTTPQTLRSSVREWTYPEPTHWEGLHSADVDGDGHILTMRVRDDELGDYKVSAEDPRLLVRRGPDDIQGPFYRLYPEGYLEDYDGYEVKIAPRKLGLDFNRNYPMWWKPETQVRGSGPYPFSEPETRAVGDFLLSHRNIAGALSYHTSGGVILRAMCTDYDRNMPPQDLRMMQTIGDRGKEITGYPCVSIFEGFTFNKSRPSAGSFMDFAYDYLGIISYATELWDINAQAGLPKRSMSEMMQLTEKQREKDALQLLKWNDEVLGGAGFVNWREFEHPQLGTVEIGGWLPKAVRQNAPAQLLEAECEKNMRFSLVHAATLPQLKLRFACLEPLADNCYRVTAVVENAGYLPTSGSAKAEQNKIVPPVVVEVQLPEGGRVLHGEARKELGHLPGRATPGVDPRRKAEWVVYLPEGGQVTVVASSPRAGRAVCELEQ